MATLEDKLLGEKLHYYCSSSEDEEDNESSNEDDYASAKVKQPGSPPPIDQWNGTSSNTGPKGVLKDWQRYKQLETEQRIEQEKEKMRLAKKLALSCRSHLDDEKDKEDENEEVDGFLLEYIQKRMDEMMKQAGTSAKPKYGTLAELYSGNNFLEAIDKEDKHTTVIIHLYEKSAIGCEAMNGVLQCLASEYPFVKFCKIKASAAGLSRKFRGYGLPALLVYKGGQMIGNFVRLVDEFGEDYYANDVEAFLIEHGILQDSSLVPPSKQKEGS